MRRVAVTGMGIVSSIGNNTQEVLSSLREAKSGIVRAKDYAERGFRCQVHGEPVLNWEEMIDRRVRRFMGAGAGWNYIAMQQAIVDSGLTENEVSHERTGLIMGSGGPSTRAIVAGGGHDPRKGPAQGRPVRGAQGDVEHELGHARHARSTSRASTIRSRRPAPPRLTASATPPR